MKILQVNAGALTQFELLDFLKSRGASTDPKTRFIAPIAPSEFQVYDYLVQKAASNQTRESIKEFLKKCEKFDLAKAEKLNVIDIRPSSVVEIDPIIEDCEKRMGSDVVDELVDMVTQIFPPVQKPDQEAGVEN
ncbi:RNA polymerase II, Rpb4, core protein [Thalictrum thalictroides]|uniref:DNA-directed RNA polymerase III subunit RPC9 n=1 Tax=Thalictrum thalictroides TaxID=46969 RepID=A0A7J6WUT4_THATH|nr:RNA polymerase II, Rpb4, core protein [Thalictrum thalictroides]